MSYLRRPNYSKSHVTYDARPVNVGSNARREARRSSLDGSISAMSIDSNISSMKDMLVTVPSSSTPVAAAPALSHSTSIVSSSSNLSQPASNASSPLSHLKATPRVSLSKWRNDLIFVVNSLRESYFLSLLLLFIPMGIVAYLCAWNDTLIFLFNFIGIIPLAWMLGNATEELADRTTQTLGGLLNATFGNAVELIVSMIALQKGFIRLVQTSLLGSILSNLLLVLGMSFLVGGLKYPKQEYDKEGAHVFTSMLLMASIGITIPSCFSASMSSLMGETYHATHELLTVSRFTSLIIFTLYLLYLFFQLYTHADMFGAYDDDDDDDDEEDEDDESDEERPRTNSAARANSNSKLNHANHKKSKSTSFTSLPSSSATISSSTPMSETTPLNGSSSKPVYTNSVSQLHNIPEKGANNRDEEDGDDENRREGDVEIYDGTRLSLMGALLWLAVVTLFVSICSEYLVDSIHGVVSKWGVPESFIGLILLPIVGNAAEHATAVTVALHNKLDLSIGVAVGSSTQISLFLIPFVTLLGWAIGQPMSLDFTIFETVVLVMSVLIVKFLVNSGSTNWLEGAMLTGSYCIIAVAFYYHRDPRDNNLFDPTLAPHTTPTIAS